MLRRVGIDHLYFKTAKISEFLIRFLIEILTFFYFGF